MSATISLREAGRNDIHGGGRETGCSRSSNMSFDDVADFVSWGDSMASAFAAIYRFPTSPYTLPTHTQLSRVCVCVWVRAKLTVVINKSQTQHVRLVVQPPSDICHCRRRCRCQRRLHTHTHTWKMLPGLCWCLHIVLRSHLLLVHYEIIVKRASLFYRPANEAGLAPLPSPSYCPPSGVTPPRGVCIPLPT